MAVVVASTLVSTSGATMAVVALAIVEISRANAGVVKLNCGDMRLLIRVGAIELVLVLTGQAGACHVAPRE